MALSSQIIALEQRLSLARVPLSRVLVTADIDRSTWSRWRADKSSPTLRNWEAVNTAVDDLVGTNAPKTPSHGNTADRAPGSSLSPIPDIAGSPPSDADHGSAGEAARDISSSSSDHPQSKAPACADPVS
jgi:hypothetical protein